MIGFLKAIFGLLGGFLRWWFGELAALVPAALRDRAGSGGERLLLELAPEARRLYRLRGRKASLLASGGDLAEAARRHKGRPAITLALARAEVVTRQTQLPLAAEENLREVVGFEMDRLTPFSRDEVYYTCRMTRRDPKAGRIEIDVILAPRSKVEARLAELGDLRQRVDRLDIASDDPGRPLGVNLLPQTTRAAASWPARGVAMTLTATAAVLLFLALQIPLERKADYAAALSERVAEERARVALLRRLETEIGELGTGDTSLQDLKRADRLPLALIDQVTRLLPDDTWLSQLSLTAGRLDLSGLSPNSSKLITTFEQSPLFTEAVFRAPVTQDPRLGLERFSLSMRLTAREDSR